MHIDDLNLSNKTQDIEFVSLKCFGISQNSGNIAIVVKNDYSDELSRLAFSKKNQNTCVFMNQTNQPDTILLDFYYPHARSALCLHATLAVGYTYFNENPTLSKISVLTSMQQQSIQLIKEDERIFIVLDPQDSPIVTQLVSINSLLNTSSSNIIGTPVVASIGSPKLLIEVRNIDTLNSLTPNLDLIYEWSKNNHINGFYVYCHLNDNNYAGRNFNHLDIQLEDAATGVAAGAITVHLKQNLNLFQGANINNPCVINTKIINNKIYIGGSVTYAR